jgi:hypothetical protein
MVGRVGFEPTKAEPADLQSALVDHLSTDPNKYVMDHVKTLVISGRGRARHVLSYHRHHR